MHSAIIDLSKGKAEKKVVAFVAVRVPLWIRVPLGLQLQLGESVAVKEAHYLLPTTNYLLPTTH